MVIGINHWRAAVEFLWIDTHHSSKKGLNHVRNPNSRFVFFIALLLLTHGNIEPNPGRKSKNS